MPRAARITPHYLWSPKLWTPDAAPHLSMKIPTDAELRTARADFIALLMQRTPERTWQAFFSRNPFVLSRSLPLRLQPCDLLPLGRPGISEPDFLIHPGSSVSASIHGVIELKPNSARITSKPRKGILTLARDTATGIEQLRAYERDYDMFSPARRCVSISIQSHMFLIMGRQQEIKDLCLDLSMVERLREVFPRDIHLLTYDRLLEQYEQGLQHRSFVLLSDALSGDVSLNLRDLEAQLGTCVPLSAGQWACAVLLGCARAWITDRNPKSNAERARGAMERVDLHGALGQLLLFGIVRRLRDSKAALAYMTQRLFYDGGGAAMTGPDLVFKDRQKLIGLDVKTFDCQPHKRMFAISEASHAALHGECAGYVGLIGPRYARTTCLTKVIPYESVSDWKRGTLRKSGPPAHCHPIHEVMKTYAPAYPLGHGSSDVYPHAQIMDLARQSGPGSLIHSLSRLLPAAASALENAQKRL